MQSTSVAPSVNACPSNQDSLQSLAADLSSLIDRLRDDIGYRLTNYPSRPSEHKAWTNLENGYVSLEAGAAQLRVVIDQIRREGI